MPLTNTVIDFWRMVDDFGISTIVMLNEVRDGVGVVSVRYRGYIYTRYQLQLVPVDYINQQIYDRQNHNC